MVQVYILVGSMSTSEVLETHIEPQAEPEQQDKQKTGGENVDELNVLFVDPI